MTHSFPTRRSSELVGHAIDADDLEIVGVLPDHRQPIVAEIHEPGGQRQRPFAGGQRTDVLDMRPVRDKPLFGAIAPQDIFQPRLFGRRDIETDRKSTRMNSSLSCAYRMPSSA